MKTRIIAGWRLPIAVVAILLLLFGAGTVSASDIRSGDTLTIAAGQVIDDDLVVFANTIVINGIVNGDLVAFGNSVTVNGTVNGSAVLGGQSLQVSGTIKGTLYGGGNSMMLAPTARVERNVMFGGYNLETRPESVIARDLYLGAAQGVLGGTVGRDMQLAAQGLELNGTVGRNVNVDVGEPNQTPFPYSYGPNMVPAIPSGLRVSKNANIGGQLLYASPAAQDDAILAQPNGGVIYSAQPINKGDVSAPSPYEWLFARLRDFFTVLILGAVAIWLVPRGVNQAVTFAHDKALPATGWGLLILVAGYILAVVAFIVVVVAGIVIAMTTLGGLATATFVVGGGIAALLVSIFTVIVLWGSKIIVATLIGRLVLHTLAKSYAENLPLAFVVGLLLFEIVAAIPFLGPVVTIVTILLGVGAIWYLYYERRRTQPLPIPAAAHLPA